MTSVPSTTAAQEAGPIAGIPRTAMILAAGLGTRMKPITLARPKPLIEVAGRSLIDRTIDRLVDAGVRDLVVNIHHLGEQVRDRLERRAAETDGLTITISVEEELLETGGGVTKALPLLGAEPFLVVNGDVLWLDGCTPALRRLAALWDGTRMDALLMLHRAAGMRGYHGLGDFMIDPLGQCRRRRESEVTPYLFTGVQILHPRLFAGEAAVPFSLNRVYDRAAEAERLYGMLHDGMLFHVGTPEELREAEDVLSLHYRLPGYRQDKRGV